MEDKGFFLVKFCLCRLSAISISGDKGCSSLPDMGEKKPPKRETYALFLGTWWEQGERFLHLLFLSCLLLKITLMSKRHIV